MINFDPNHINNVDRVNLIKSEFEFVIDPYNKYFFNSANYFFNILKLIKCQMLLDNIKISNILFTLIHHHEHIKKLITKKIKFNIFEFHNILDTEVNIFLEKHCLIKVINAKGSFYYGMREVEKHTYNERYIQILDRIIKILNIFYKNILPYNNGLSQSKNLELMYSAWFHIR